MQPFLLLCGVILGPLFIIIILVEGALREGYYPMRQPGSALAIGPRGWIQRANFFITAALTLAYALGLHLALSGFLGAILLPALVGVIGLGLIGAGMFVTDVTGLPEDRPKLAHRTKSGTLHDLFSLPVFLFLFIAPFIYAYLSIEAGHWGFAIYSVLSALVLLPSFVLAGAGFSGAPKFASYGGFFQRISITAGFIWLSVVAGSLYMTIYQQPASGSALPSQIISAAKVPEGWYSHELDGFEGLTSVLAKTPDFSKVRLDGSVEHIAIVDRDIAVTPEQYLKENLNVDDSTMQFAGWTTLNGRKMFSIGFTDPNDGSKRQRMYLFSSSPAYDPSSIGHVVMVELYPDKQENRAAFQQVVNYYAQTLPMIPRTETLQACKTVNLPPGQEYEIMGDSETGYVTIGYWPDSSPGMGTMATYAFLNYNDDLSQCTPSIKKVLESTKLNANKMTQ